MFCCAHQTFLIDDGGEKDVVVSGDVLLFHLWNSLSQFNGFIYFIEPSKMYLLYFH
jgi:hypothetical protein